MLGLMQDRPLQISSLIEHAARQDPNVEIVSKFCEGTIHHSNYAGLRFRAVKLAKTLVTLGKGVPSKPDTDLARDDILDYISGRVAKLSLPDDFVFVNEFAARATGKLQKTKLRELFKGHLLPTDAGESELLPAVDERAIEKLIPCPN